MAFKKAAKNHNGTCFADMPQEPHRARHMMRRLEHPIQVQPRSDTDFVSSLASRAGCTVPAVLCKRDQFLV